MTQHSRKKGEESTTPRWKLSSMLIMLFVSTLVVAEAVYLGNVFFSAYSPDKKSTFVVFLSEYKDTSPLNTRSAHGWGATSVLKESVAQLSPSVFNCRVYHRENVATPYRFEVKLNPDSDNFDVVSILQGAETNPTLAACLREKINRTHIPLLSQVPRIDPDNYSLKIEVQSNLGRELPP